MTPCTGILGRLFGHKYEARYSKGRPAGYEFSFMRGVSPVEYVEAHKPVIYEHDICTRCGHVVNKEQK